MSTRPEDAFEIEEKDLLGRVGVLETRHGRVRTPAIAPVVNPTKPVLQPAEIASMGFDLLMTNSYIIKRSHGSLAVELGVHGLLGVDTPVMTDSGAYQLMVYGSVDVGPREILEYQISLGSDIGVILDIPTRIGIPKGQVEREVEETLRRAEEAAEMDRGGMLLVGPVQGGQFLDVVSRAAARLSRMDVDIYAVGGPTQLMEEYRFEELVRLVMAAKMNLPVGKPLHLFGAGHPLILPLAAAMGADIFDSASYVLYARDERYITSSGTLRLREMSELPCSCPVCSRLSLEDLRDLPKQERIVELSRHNLYVLLEEVRRIREAISEGRLWDLVRGKAALHPSLRKAFSVFARYVPFIEKYHPVSRPRASGIHFTTPLDRYRPEVYRYFKTLAERYKPPPRRVLVVIQETADKPFSRFGWISLLLRAICREGLYRSVHLAVLSPAYGVIPLELDGYYPLSQYEAPRDLYLDYGTLSSDVAWYVANSRSYSRVLLIHYDLPPALIEEVERKVRGLGLEFFRLRAVPDREDIGRVTKTVGLLVAGL